MKHLPTDSSKTSAIDALADFYLTEQEWNYLLALRAAEHGLERVPMDAGDPGAMADICVLAGVAERPDPDSGDRDALKLTDLGRGAVTVLAGMSPAMRAQVYYLPTEDSATVEHAAVEPQKPAEAVACIEPAPRITVGSLVRHKPSGAVGLVTEHSMWDGDWGAYRAALTRPTQIGRAVVSTLVDRADRWEKVA